MSGDVMTGNERQQFARWRLRKVLEQELLALQYAYANYQAAVWLHWKTKGWR